jgi:hypothetical protein
LDQRVSHIAVSIREPGVECEILLKSNNYLLNVLSVVPETTDKALHSEEKDLL